MGRDFFGHCGLSGCELGPFPPCRERQIFCRRPVEFGETPRMAFVLGVFFLVIFFYDCSWRVSASRRGWGQPVSVLCVPFFFHENKEAPANRPERQFFVVGLVLEYIGGHIFAFREKTFSLARAFSQNFSLSFA